MKLLGGFSTGAKAAFEEAGRIASEAISNNRTVASFAAHERVVARFQHALSGPLEASRKSSIVSGVAFGFSQGVIFAQYALNFWWGGYLISDGEIDFQQMLQALFGIVAAAMVSGQVQQVMPDVQKAVDGRKRIFHLLSLVPQIDSASPLGARATFTEGRVEFKDVHFTYPNRPDTEVLRGVSVSVERGQTLALVGPSGSGKSTLVSLLLRFYDAAKGSVTIDGVAVKDMNVAALRAQLGLVSQEPRLFDASVEENIRYGNRLATEQEVVEAALKANVHGVIMGFPDGYKTTVGPKGSKISGGQKQRIAIARALIRKPKVLLLDEATSALDSESEKVVQEALEKLMAAKSQTVIIVAHRLSTIRNADIIAVLDKGAVVEVGNHESLVRKGGVYASLVRAMSASNS
jgi:ABC-type multidrug transport system fused ATPase/permease subunit